CLARAALERQGENLVHAARLDTARTARAAASPAGDATKREKIQSAAAARAESVCPLSVRAGIGTWRQRARAVGSKSGENIARRPDAVGVVVTGEYWRRAGIEKLGPAGRDGAFAGDRLRCDRLETGS